MNKPPYIIVCEDDESILEVISIVLTDKGYEIKGLSSGEYLDHEIQKKKPDIVFVDLWMPGISGDELTRKLKAQESTKDIAVLIISANKDVASIAKNSGADGYLSKPFDISDLEQLVLHHLPTN